MIHAALLQQQRVPQAHGVTPTPVPVPASVGPWDFWRPDQLADVLQCPQDAVTSDWPLVFEALRSYGICCYDTCRAALATIAIETAHTFKPVTEAFWLSDAWRYANLRYAPYWGRGYIQLTWPENYRYYGWKIGHPELVDFPDKALVPEIAASIFGAYFDEKGIQQAARVEDWSECRRLVQGGYAGLEEFINTVTTLDEIKAVEPITLSGVLQRGYDRIGDPYVWDGEQPGAFDCSGFIKWCYNGAVDSYTDTIYLQTNESATPFPGDIVLYEYYDESQPNTRFPHVGLWLNETDVLDARYPQGVGVHHHIVGVKQYIRRVSGVMITTQPPA